MAGPNVAGGSKDGAGGPTDAAGGQMDPVGGTFASPLMAIPVVPWVATVTATAALVTTTARTITKDGDTSPPEVEPASEENFAVAKMVVRANRALVVGEIL